MKKLLRRIVLFPLSILMGNIDGAATSTEAGTAPVTATAEAQGQVSTTATDNTAGAAPATESAEVQDGQNSETTSTEGATDATEGSDKGAHQTTLEERVQALAEKRISEVETKLTAKLEEVTRAKAEEKPNFYEIDMEKVNCHIRDTMDQIEALKLEGNFLEAMELQDGLGQLRNELRGNEQRKAEWMQRTQAQQQSAAQNAQINQHIEQASALVAKEHNIPAEVWKAGEEFFLKERQSKPLIDAQYREKVLVQGPVAAMLWAKDYVEKNMGAPQQALIDKKEAAKQTLPPGKTSTGEATGSADLAALRTKAGSGNAEDLAAYMAAKSRAAAT